MRTLSIWVRAAAIGLISAATLVVYLARRAALGRASPEAVRALQGEVLAGLLQRLGATYVKFGQILSTRPDLIPPEHVTALARLQDAVAAAPFAAIERVLDEDLTPAQRKRLTAIDPVPVAAASVAQVHRATLEDGSTLALKVQRPEAAEQIDRDLAVLALGAALLDRLPSLHLLSLPGAVARFGEALRGQLDFTIEAENNRRFTRNFAGSPDIHVPRLIDGLCTRRVLAMEFIDGVKATEPERVGGDRRRLARVGGECILKMVFSDGFVHADLHPGNIILTPDGKVVLIDLGMVTEIPGDLLRPWVETFFALSQNDGAAAARLFYVHAPTVGNVDYPVYQREVVERIDVLYGKRLGDVEVSAAVSGMMNVLRRHRVQIDPSFTVVNVAMLVAEGLGKQLDPDIDLIPLAMPYLADAMLKAPPGRAPLRDVPAALALPPAAGAAVGESV